MNKVRQSALVVVLVGSVLTSVKTPTHTTLASSSQIATAAVTNADWPQAGRDAQRTNYSPLQIDPPYCYDWKWDEAPISSRVQPVVRAGRLFIGSDNGIFYARDAATGDSLWAVKVGSPIRNTAATSDSAVFFSTHDGWTYALNAANGTLIWRIATGSSVTAALFDETRNRVIVASTTGSLTALNAADGGTAWRFDAGTPILTTPALSADNNTVFLGDESVSALAINATSGALIWRTPLQGQSLADRYPVVSGNTVFYRSQPLQFFHKLLQEGDDAMDGGQAAASKTWTYKTWQSDWNTIKPRIASYLTQNPDRQTFFALDAATGAMRGNAAVLYAYGNNDNAQTPVIKSGNAYLSYRARHGIQTDSNTTHVTSRYDAELGRLSVQSLDIVPLSTTAQINTGNPEFRMTSDEDAYLSMGGNILFVDSWERLGGVNVSTRALVPVASVSTNWGLECFAAAPAGCGSGAGYLNFFPLSGNNGDPNYPFPSPRQAEGTQRGGVVIANNRLYWRVVAGGLSAISHSAGGTCPAPRVQPITTNVVDLAGYDTQNFSAPARTLNTQRPLADYVSLDLTTPANNAPADLVARLRAEVDTIVSTNDHLMPLYLQRGFSVSRLWPHDSTQGSTPPAAGFAGTGNLYWHDPGELLYSMALAYPYLDAPLQQRLKTYLAAEMQRYPSLDDLPYADANRDWLRTGAARERYAVPMRAQLNAWPPPAASLNAMYALWLWSKNTGDWSYAQQHWAQAISLFNARRGSMNYYADIAGAIGYARLAQHFGDGAAQTAGTQAAVAAMQAGLDFNARRVYARQQYPSPRDEDQPNPIYDNLLRQGWTMPVFYGLTPEVGLYLAEQLSGQAQQHILSREQGDSLQWWYMTRAGLHAEMGETSFIAPEAAWSHFLAQAFILGQPREKLTRWLDRPWARGDLYSIQKVVATIQTQTTITNITPTPTPVTPTPTVTVTVTPPVTPTVTPTPTATLTPTGCTTFPKTPVLDAFDRANGLIGTAWAGYNGIDKFAIANNALDVIGNEVGMHIEWVNTVFSRTQEVFVTLKTIDPTASEIDLVLMRQQGEVAVYAVLKPATNSVDIQTFDGNGWQVRGTLGNAGFVNGSRFGARLGADGVVEVYRDGQSIGRVSVAAWQYLGSANGRIGLSVDTGPATLLDDFGGGAFVCGP